MKRVIFTIYDDIKNYEDTWNINSFAQESTKEYFDRLVQNKKDYADSIQVEFKFFYNTMKDFNVNTDLEFTKVNLYKHHIMAELANEYDEIMYVDMDVVFNTNRNVFEELDLSKGIHIKDQDKDVLSKNADDVLFHDLGLRNPTLKYHITKDLLEGKDNHVLNTGIMIGTKEHIKMIKFNERLSDTIQKIQDLKMSCLSGEKTTYLRMYYYPNNESIFSFILEKYEIPYVIMEDAWNCIIDHTPKLLNWDDMHIAHMVNKKFNAFFNDKTKCIFSIYIDIPDEKLDNPKGPHDDPVNKSKRTKERLSQYKDKLIDNHSSYAKSVSADYKLFTRDNQYEEFFNRYPDLSEYDVINLYKIYLLDILSQQYDLVLYVDLDVYFTNSVDAFNWLPAESMLCCNISSGIEAGVNLKNPAYFETYDKDFRNPQSKYWNAHALLVEEDLDGDNDVFNTGIVMASRKVMEKLNYFTSMEKTISKMKELKEFSMYPQKIQQAFGYDNETIMSYKVKKNSIPVYKLEKMWHHKHDYNSIRSYEVGSHEFNRAKNKLEIDIEKENIQMIHFISKNFGLVFG